MSNRRSYGSRKPGTAESQDSLPSLRDANKKPSAVGLNSESKVNTKEEATPENDSQQKKSVTKEELIRRTLSRKSVNGEGFLQSSKTSPKPSVNKGTAASPRISNDDDGPPKVDKKASVAAPRKSQAGKLGKASIADQKRVSSMKNVTDSPARASRVSKALDEKQRKTFSEGAEPSKTRFIDDGEVAGPSTRKTVTEGENGSSGKTTKLEEGPGTVPVPAFEDDDRDSMLDQVVSCVGGVCKTKSITLGEPEKEQLKSVGRHLLKIGRQLLQEMNYVESLLGKFTSLGLPDQPSPEELQEPRQSVQEKEQEPCKEQEQPNACCALLHPTATDNTGLDKAQLLDAMMVQAQRLSWLQEVTEGYKNAANAAQFGSAFGSPAHSVDKIRGSGLPRTSTKIHDEEARKRINIVEAKMEKMSEAIDDCHKLIGDLHSKIQMAMSKMETDSEALREEIQLSLRQSEQAKASVDDKVKNLEAQIIKLAQVVWELKCETKAQMHFGSAIIN